MEHNAVRAENRLPRRSRARSMGVVIGNANLPLLRLARRRRLVA